MAKTTVVWRSGMHFCTSTPSGQLMCDESSEIGAAYPSAPELLMASLGSCIGSVLVYFSERHGISLEGMSIGLDWSIVEHPHRIGNIEISVSIPRALSADERRVLARVAEECLIHNTLTHPPAIRLSLSGKK
jgi:putative redox protein